MANKKRKPGRPAKKAGADDQKKSPSFWRGAGAVALIIAGIVLAFGFIISAPLPHDFWNGAWWAFGAASFLVPFGLIYLGILKFASSDQEIPLAKLAGTLCLLVFTSSWLYTMFLHADAATGTVVGSHGGEVGKSVGSLLADGLGRFLASLVFVILTLFSIIFTFGIESQSLLKIGRLFRRQPLEGEEDLAALKSKLAPGFQLKEGVPVEHGGGRLPSARDAAQKLAPAEPRGALTMASDPDWQFPPLDLLSEKQDKADAGNVQSNAEIIKETFSDFNINVEVEGANVGPRITQYTIKPPSGVKLTKLTGLDSNLALDLAAHSIRMEAPIPGTRSVGVEVPNVRGATVTIRGLFTSPEWQEAHSRLEFVVGKDIAGVPVVADLEEMPHLLIAGQTKSGKSVMINTLLASLLYRNTPSDIKLILVDPKHVEMAPYEDIPHLLAPVISEPEKCISALKWAVAEMERRLKTFAEVKQRDIQSYNKLKKEEGMPYIIIVIDELADLMMVATRDVEALIARIAQKARAAGIHLVVATQRPDANVVTGIIKANIPARMAFAVQDQVNSRIIIDQIGADKLLGRGDMLYKTTDINRPIRIQGALITGDETNKLCDFLRSQKPPQYDEEVVSQPVQLNGRGGVVAQIEGDDNDDMWKDAVQVVIDNRKASTSLLQRKLRVGYGRASRLMDMMEEQGIIGPADGAKPREVLVNSIDQVFTSVPQPAATPESEDVYDDMPDE